jgi:hypothetical protein
VQVPRRVHGDPECLGFVAARDRAAVIVRQHYDRLAAQLGPKHALARHIEIVAVDEGDRAAHGHSMRMLRVMTPHTSKACPSAIGISGKAGFSACAGFDNAAKGALPPLHYCKAAPRFACSTRFTIHEIM